MNITYLLINLLSISVPLLFSFHPKINFWNNWRAWFPAILIPAILFIIWDVIFTKMGVWGFNEKYLIGFYLFGLPIEEILFFFAIPYACLFTYHTLKLFFKDGIGVKLSRFISVVFGLSVLVIGLLNFDRIYTSFTFILTSLFIFGTLFFSKVEFWKNFYVSYAVIFAFPFILVNGTLTGMWFDEPVVWYNNSENMGIRFITIPVEDFVYGFLLTASNTYIYELILNKTEKLRN